MRFNYFTTTTPVRKYERSPLVSLQTSSYPNHDTSSPLSHFQDSDNRSRGHQQISIGPKNTYTSVLDEPPSYQREFTDFVDERYQLVNNRRENLSHSDMDLEVQRMREKDNKLKTNIRKFRFVVRCAHLACRFVAPRYLHC